ncbi:MAG TPA: phosphate ABC transporter permease subunit PstC [Desulfotomaculum sp.]|jgi:phosphate transport system permease protein|nr:phosphate ABC transporter permease subunit PstC [Desulfotomaculum sp.]
MSRYSIDRISRHAVSVFGIAAFLILVFIGIFILKESSPALWEVGITDILLRTEWYPSREAFGILNMLIGSVATTLLALVIAVPLSVGCAIFLAEVAPPHIRELARPAVDLLVGIPSVVYGLVGMIVLCPFIASLSGSGSGSSVLAAAIILAIMVLPTIISISEDSIRAVPAQHKEGSLALGATHWQTIYLVLLPAARRGIIAAVILGTGRAIGETMAMIMVIGNSPIFPATIFGPARTLTGNIALEISYATGIHESVLFVTGLVLFILVMLINSIGLIAYRGNS